MFKFYGTSALIFTKYTCRLSLSVLAVNARNVFILSLLMETISLTSPIFTARTGTVLQFGLLDMYMDVYTCDVCNSVSLPFGITCSVWVSSLKNVFEKNIWIGLSKDFIHVPSYTYEILYDRCRLMPLIGIYWSDHMFDYKCIRDSLGWSVRNMLSLLGLSVKTTVQVYT